MSRFVAEKEDWPVWLQIVSQPFLIIGVVVLVSASITLGAIDWIIKKVS